MSPSIPPSLPMVLPNRTAVLQLYARVKQPLPHITPSPSPYSSHLTPSHTSAALESHFFNSPSSSPTSPSPFTSALSFTSHDSDAALDAALAASPPLTSPGHPSRHRTLLGLDVGERHIGVAVSDATLTLPTPLPCLTRTPHALTPLIRTLTALLITHSTAGLIIGLPLSPHGALTPQAHRIQHITAQLLTELPHPHPLLMWWDESYSSRMSREVVREAGMDVRRMKEKGVVDSGAAAIILQSFLDHLRGVVDSERNRLREARREEKRKQGQAQPATTHPPPD